MKIFSPERARMRALSGLKIVREPSFPGLRPGLSQRGPLGLGREFAMLQPHCLLLLAQHRHAGGWAIGNGEADSPVRRRHSRVHEA